METSLLTPSRDARLTVTVSRESLDVLLTLDTECPSKLLDMIKQELGSQFRIVIGESTPPREGIAHVTVICDPRSLKAAIERCRMAGAHRFIALHYPNNPRDRRFGRMSVVDGITYVENVSRGSIHEIDDGARTIRIIHDDLEVLAKETRRIIRDQLFLTIYEAQGGIILHAASLEINGRGVLIAGDSGSGKTTLALDVLATVVGARVMSFDRTLAFRTHNTLRLTGLAEKTSFFPGTLVRYKETASLVKGIRNHSLWSRSSKFDVRWQEINRLFDTPGATVSASVDLVIFPSYSNGPSRVIDILDARDHLRGVSLSHGNPIERGAWLGWYQFDEDLGDSTLALIKGIRSLELEWQEPEWVTNQILRSLQAMS